MAGHTKFLLLYILSSPTHQSQPSKAIPTGLNKFSPFYFMSTPSPPSTSPPSTFPVHSSPLFYYSSSPPPLQKCCPPFHIFNSSHHCVPSEDRKAPQDNFYTNHHSVLTNCMEELEVVDFMYGVNYSAMEIDTSEICLEIITSANDSQDMRIVIVRCKNSPDRLSNSSAIIVFTIFGAVSLLSLSIIFIVYLIIPEFNSLHGKIVLSNVVSITFLTAFFLTVFNANIENYYLCKITGYFGYFSSISMFSWMTIMCFDLCSTFLREENLHYSSQHIRFVSYSVAGWGSGLILAIVLLLLEHSLPPQSDFNAEIGDQKCFISTRGGKILYLFHLPILIIMLINIFFFVIIIIFLIVGQLKTKQARITRRDNTGGEDRERTKNISTQTREQLLFLIFGIPWIIESVHFIIHNHYGQPCQTIKSSDIFFRVIDSFNMLRGFFMFIIFICNKNVWTKIKHFLSLKYRSSSMELMERQIHIKEMKEMCHVQGTS